MSSPPPNDQENSNDPRLSTGPSRPMFSVSWFVVMLVAISAVFFLSMMFRESSPKLDYMFLWRQIEAGNVERAVFQGDLVHGKFKSPPPKPTKDSPDIGETFDVFLPLPLDHQLMEHMRKNGVQIVGKPESSWANGMMILINAVSLLAFVGFMWFLLRRKIGRAHV